MIPLPVILVEFLFVLGVASFLGHGLALVRLRRDGNWPPVRDAGPAPSAVRIVVGIVLGAVVTLWALATWISAGYSL